ncbi:uncharacterized protein LOC120282119 [Dioscorea cayenensis subsp. rotundata]|uniref:Uncharacterized protein LOC120282119 n=1 Tax=Dioscorea cayennensis subsp. rotundata TaxID=55577 RepID=A0AB40CXI4_DIOCR|nr:uncharacterized protein LOC120282119 [Dioscorea cayenensis subsp. rotundata]
MGIEEFRTYIQSHPNEAVYINKPIEDYEEMAIVCGNDQATGSFARTGSQSSRSLGVRMEMPSTPPTLDSDDQPQGLDDWDFTQSQPPPAETPTTSTSKVKEVNKGSKRIRREELEVMQKISIGLDRLASAAETDKGVQLSKRLYDEVMTLIGYYNKSDLGLAYDHLNAQNNLATAFINKDHDLRCFWMDGFLRQLGRDGGV